MLTKSAYDFPHTGLCRMLKNDIVHIESRTAILKDDIRFRRDVHLCLLYSS